MQTNTTRAKRHYIDSQLTVDLAFPVKFHRSLFTDEAIRSLVETRFRVVAKQLGVTILHMEVQSDHVRLRAQIPPDLSVMAFATKLKSDSTRAIYANFPALKSRLATIWPWSLFCRSTGASLPGAIDDYLARNKGLHLAAV